jgi:hypothetical protein
MGKESPKLEKNQIYLIEGSEMSYVGSDGSKHYFVKIDQNGNPKGRKRMLMGTEENIARVLQSRLSSSLR